MSDRGLRRRTFLGTGLAAALTGPWVLRHPRAAEAGPEEDGVVKAAKKSKPADLNGMIWSLYYRNMQRLSDEFRGLTGIGVKNIQDITVFQIPQRAMAEALSRSGEFDFFHVDSNMIPSLASAGLLEPLDPYIKETGYKLDMVGNFASFMQYKGQTYGIPTDATSTSSTSARTTSRTPRSGSASPTSTVASSRGPRPGTSTSKCSSSSTGRTRGSPARAACATGPTAPRGGTCTSTARAASR